MNRKSKNVSQELIRFDWAMKRLLREKSKYTVLEGFLTVVLQENVKIVSIKESESNQTSANDKFNRVDIIVENTQGELIIVEMQNNEKVDYFFRMIYGVSKSVVEHISKGEDYGKVRKVFHINIIYFKLGVGNDYVYRGYTEFRGLHTHDLLELTEKEKAFFVGNSRANVERVSDLFPEYFLICVEDFNNVVEDSLDEWIYYFKNNTIPDAFNAPGLEEARQKLLYNNLSEQEKRDHDYNIEQKLHEKSIIDTALFTGKFEGRAEGRAEGEEERNRLKAEKEAAQAEKEAAQAEKEVAQAKMKQKEIETVTKSHKAGIPVETISIIAGLSIEEVKRILEKNPL